MAAFLPIIIQAAEALALGLGTMVAAHQACVVTPTEPCSWSSAFLVGIAAALGKAMPSQILGSKKA